MDVELLDRFESLGDNCEFGFVQRYFGREPLELLRWAGTSLPGLVRAFESDFAELYRLEDLRPVTPNLVVDDKYDIRFHTHLPIRRASEGDGYVFDAEGEALREAHAKELAHVGFMLDKFLESFEAREKIYIYKANAGVSRQEAEALHAALCRHGPQRLLVVATATADLPEGEVRRVAPGLKMAGLHRLADYAHAEDAPFDAWALVLEAAAAGGWEAGEGEDVVRTRNWFPPRALAMSEVRRQVVEGVYRGLFARRPDGRGFEDYVRLLEERGLAKGLDVMLRRSLGSDEFKARS